MTKIETFVLYIGKTGHIAKLFGLTLSNEPKRQVRKRL